MTKMNTVVRVMEKEALQEHVTSFLTHMQMIQTSFLCVSAFSHLSVC